MKREVIQREIEDNNSLSSEVKKTVLSKEELEKLYYDEEYETYRVEYIGDFAQKISETGIAQIFLYDKFFATLFVKVGMLNTILKQFPEIISVDKSVPFTLLDLESTLEEHKDENIALKATDLDGSGVIVGILGTGIDYTDESFIDDKGSTRIISIWDQTLREGPSPETFVFGTEFKREEINKAIIAQLIGNDPYEIVNHKDDTGFGTKVTKIIGGRKKTSTNKNNGLAANCEFIVVKVKKANKSNLRLWGLEDYSGDVYDSNTISAGFRYLYLMGKKLNKPVVVYNPFVTNVGARDGGTLLERYLDFFTNERGYSVVTSTGNQGASAVHFNGNLKESKNIMKVFINIDKEQRNIFFTLYYYNPDKISLVITTPTGESTSKIEINPVEGEVKEVKLGESLITLQYFIEGAQYPSQRIDCVIRNLTNGVWILDLNKEFILNGMVDLWLQQKEFSVGNTGLLEFTEAVTLMTPAAARNLIVASSYNEIEGKILETSSRGFTRDGRISPIVAVMAKDILVNGYKVSGTAVSTAILTGVVALIYQWGIVNGNDLNMYSTKIKGYLVASTLKEEGKTYPNIETGFGVLNIEMLFKELNLKANSNRKDSKPCSLECYETLEKLYIRLPREFI